MSQATLALLAHISPYYFVAMVFHDQSVDIRRNIDAFETHLTNLGYACHAVHTGPLIRRESVYANDFVEDRKRLYNALFNFVRKLDIQYASAWSRRQNAQGACAHLQVIKRFGLHIA